MTGLVCNKDKTQKGKFWKTRGEGTPKAATPGDRGPFSQGTKCPVKDFLFPVALPAGCAATEGADLGTITPSPVPRPHRRCDVVLPWSPSCSRSLAAETQMSPDAIAVLTGLCQGRGDTPDPSWSVPSPFPVCRDNHSRCGTNSFASLPGDPGTATGGDSAVGGTEVAGGRRARSPGRAPYRHGPPVI